ncbi:hypothetical protein DRN76_02150 [Methanosarcinales archaeon]|nr:MAG: hypothetical protein DRN76_02150 [Methanosarcinales archaeon]
MDAVKIKRLFFIPVCLVLALILGMIYHPAISWLVCAWPNNEYYNYGLLLLPVSAFLIWHKRSEIYRTEPAVRHVIPLGAGFFLYVAGVFLHQPTLFVSRCCLSRQDLHCSGSAMVQSRFSFLSFYSPSQYQFQASMDLQCRCKTFLRLHPP